ncbi:MAG TPA: hypothetical protein VFV38_46325 [Ktedonobacteraceae bacterium]|nr:hypothetical protein [Ktedonobacteraceae bacterium]
MKDLLQPIANLEVPILGVISDAHHSERLAVAQLWPTVPHQTCQFHSLREASRPMDDQDRGMRTAMRKTIQNRLRKTRNQWSRNQQLAGEEMDAAKGAEREQLQILADYATSIGTALNLEGIQPFEYPGVAAYDALEEIESSLVRLEKKGLLEATCSKRDWLDSVSFLACESNGASQSSKCGE